MPNLLTTRATLTTGPLFLETLVKHYFARVASHGSKTDVPIRREELLYDEAFSIVKDFMEVATRHTVEELQSFSNIRTPSPPSFHIVRIIIPMASCDEAAPFLIRAFGGEDAMKRVVGGTKWWQVRGIRGLDAEWISAKKDWKNAQRRAKERGATPQEHTAERPELREPLLNGVSPELEGDAGASPKHTESPRDSAAYQPEMGEMRCILYSHGGGYYFGSVDQERYGIQRYARKIHGRVLAVNYRLAPQYPFPCAIQDLLAAYIFLIRPPKGAAHRSISPAHIVIAGDSAGGGLSLALLQVIRDAGLPAPAGGVLISPWCDLTHSFPSTVTNTDTDVIPRTGLCLHKPSPLWPPPPLNVTFSTVRRSRRKSIVEVLSGKARPVDQEDASHTTDSASLTPLPGVLDVNQSFVLRTDDGEVLEVPQQVHLYAPNGLLKHPLVSPVLSYLGDLPPLFIIAGDKEVLRDEIIYVAHRAAHPDQFPIRDETKDLYPAFDYVERDMRPTPVHLQVYDDVAHVLPVLFPFTTPGKYCHRAMASFYKHVMDVRMEPEPSTSTSTMPPNENEPQHLYPPKMHASRVQRVATSVTRRCRWLRPPPQATGEPTMYSDTSAEVVSPRTANNAENHAEDVRKAGEASVYAGDWARSDDNQGMIRERISTQGLIRPLEPAFELPALQVSEKLIGIPSEHAMRRYITGHAHFEKKFARAIRRIAQERKKLEHNVDSEQPVYHMLEGWEDERPPRSSIVARRDTHEARRLAQVADKAVLVTEERALSANNLWNVVVGFLSASPADRRDERAHGGRAAGFVSFFGRTRREEGTEVVRNAEVR